MTCKFEAIIWDCDGVLMDSEMLSCSVSTKFFRDLGVDVDVDYYIDNCMGHKLPDVLENLGKKSGIKLSEIVTEEDIKKRNETKLKVFSKELKAIPYVKEFLEQLKLPCAIASASSLKRLYSTLEFVGLKTFFSDDRIFSSKLMKQNKTEPDLWLMVAESLGVDPKKCLVVEDSSKGTIGAKKAGMTVFGFTGASHMTQKRIEGLKSAEPKLLFDDMSKLSDLLMKV